MAEFKTDNSPSGTRTSPGGFEFGVQGWSWADPVPRSITFYLDGTVGMADQYGRPIKGFLVDGKEVWLASTPPADNPPYPQRRKDTGGGKSVPYATHAEVVAALVADHIDWQKLPCSGWPQLPYAELKKLPKLPPTPAEELRRIPNTAVRKDALRARREADESLAAELAEAGEE